jgi:hypothetical protein
MAPDATPDFSACPLPAQLTQLTRQPAIPATSNRCPFELAPVTCGGAWAIPVSCPALRGLGFAAGGVRQHPLARSTRPPGVPPVVQWEGSSSLVISSHQQQSTTTTNSSSPNRRPGTNDPTHRHRLKTQEPDKTTHLLAPRQFDAERQHAWLRLLQLQPQCGATRPRRAPAQGDQHRNNHCRVHIRWRCGGELPRVAACVPWPFNPTLCPRSPPTHERPRARSSPTRTARSCTTSLPTSGAPAPAQPPTPSSQPP